MVECGGACLGVASIATFNNFEYLLPSDSGGEKARIPGDTGCRGTGGVRVYSESVRDALARRLTLWKGGWLPRPWLTRPDFAVRLDAEDSGSTSYAVVPLAGSWAGGFFVSV